MKESGDMKLIDWVKFAAWQLIPFLIIAWALGSSKRYAFADKYAQGNLLVAVVIGVPYIIGLVAFNAFMVF